MARKLRVHYPGAIYHVIARGNNKEMIYYDDEDKIKYLALVAKYKEKYDFNLLAYVLMDNHVHMITQVVEQPISKIMQGIQLTYTQYFNHKYSRVGHAFQQRYKAFLCAEDAYLINLICYIHQNPVRASIKMGLDYSWSSHFHYVNGKDGLVNSSFGLSLLNKDKFQAIRIYLSLVGGDLLTIEHDTNINASPSDENAGVMLLPSASEGYGGEKVTTIEAMAEQLAVHYGIEAAQIFAPCRIRQVTAARNQLIVDAVSNGIASKIELARRLGIDPARITRVYQAITMHK